eukprot:CAMPEP_0168564052 /NCGR_PEP_ID=MMETSP0413-20121227/13019_1 /TAXON_ID=136452 /ORGANISM="Filamoeba nolandi, Strain NC-AS-23-1" /LENGTH=184 /DNA_ID=CAMNT_0008595657 /DNA_START=232 /DNA_END=786 /DNA_ORIENTATION=+
MKADAILLSENFKTASRPEGGSNPVVLTTKPFTRNHNKYSAKLDAFGEWVGFGLSDERIKLNDSSILGQQSGCLNGALFQQGGTNIKMRYSTSSSSESEKGVKRFGVGDVITVEADFDSIEVKYYVNGKNVGASSLEPVKQDLLQGKLFPAIDISKDTRVTLVPTKLASDMDRDLQLDFVSLGL